MFVNLQLNSLSTFISVWQILLINRFIYLLQSWPSACSKHSLFKNTGLKLWPFLRSSGRKVPLVSSGNIACYNFFSDNIMFQFKAGLCWWLINVWLFFQPKFDNRVSTVPMLSFTLNNQHYFLCCSFELVGLFHFGFCGIFLVRQTSQFLNLLGFKFPFLSCSCSSLNEYFLSTRTMCMTLVLPHFSWNTLTDIAADHICLLQLLPIGDPK